MAKYKVGDTVVMKYTIDKVVKGRSHGGRSSYYGIGGGGYLGEEYIEHYRVSDLEFFKSMLAMAEIGVTVVENKYSTVTETETETSTRVEGEIVRETIVTTQNGCSFVFDHAGRLKEVF